MAIHTKPRTVTYGRKTYGVFTHVPGTSGMSLLQEAPQPVNVGVSWVDGPPDWRARIKAKLSATTLLEGSDFVVEGEQDFRGEVVIIRTNYYGDPIGLVDHYSFDGTSANLTGAYNPFVEGSEAKADNEAKMEFVKNALKHQQSLQGLASLGELGQTIKLIRDPARALRAAVDNFFTTSKNAKLLFQEKRRKGKNTWKSLKNMLAGTWLEWSFGVQPLVSDIQGGAQALARLIHYHPPTAVVVGKGKNETVGEPRKGTYNLSNVRLKVTNRTFTRAQVKYVGCITLDFPAYRPIQGQLGVTFRDVVPAVWELIPYSFLVDYFTNVQEIVNAACFANSSLRWVEKGVELISGSELIDAHVDVEDLGLNILQQNSIASFGGTQTYHRGVRRSEGISTNWVPPLEFQLPNSPKKWLNIAALIVQGEGLHDGLRR